MSDRVLLVDDEPRVLDGYRRGLRRRYDVAVADSADKALEMLDAEGPFAVIVSDYQMPGTDGITLLSEVAQRAPDTIRMMLTGQADLGVATAAVNDGRVFRFLTKPCSATDLALALDAGIEHHRLIRAERELLEGTLHGTVRLMTELMGLLDADSYEHGARLRKLVERMLDEFPATAHWQVELAAELSQLGTLTLPPGLRRKLRSGRALTAREAQAVAEHPRTAHDLLADIPRLGPVAAMIGAQQAPPMTRPRELSLEDPDDLVAAGAHALNVAIEFDRLAQAGTPADEAVRILEERSSSPFRARLLARLALEPPEPTYRRATLAVSDLRVGMVVDQNVDSHTGMLLLGAGREITGPILQHLHRFKDTVGVVEPIEVLIPTS